MLEPTRTQQIKHALDAMTTKQFYQIVARFGDVFDVLQPDRDHRERTNDDNLLERMSHEELREIVLGIGSICERIETDRRE